MGARGLFILEDVAGVRAWGEAVVVGEGTELPGEGATAYGCIIESCGGSWTCYEWRTTVISLNLEDMNSTYDYVSGVRLQSYRRI